MKRLTALALASFAALTSAQAETATYAIDPTHTFVTFEVRHFGTSTNRGRFDKKEGSVTLDAAAKTGRVEVIIDTNSINTGTEPFNAHLKKEFFVSAEFPTAKFVGDKFSFDGDKVTAVAGNLTLHGQTKPVTLKATNYNCYQSPMLKREVCGGDFETTITRSDFGINAMLPFIPDTVHLVIQIEAVKQ
jgi:polyisoprenoid-binding protein YceI